MSYSDLPEVLSNDFWADTERDAVLVCDEAGTIEEEELLCWGVTVETEAAGLAEPTDGAVTADVADTADGAETADGAGRADTTDDTESVEWDDADTVVGVDMDELEPDGTVTLAETALAAGEGDAALATELCVCFDWTDDVVGAEEATVVFAVVVRLVNSYHRGIKFILPVWFRSRYAKQRCYK